MTTEPSPTTRPRFYYGWVIVGLSFLVLLVSAGSRAAPGVLMTPMEHEMGWTAATISIAVAINIVLFGFMGPFTAALMQTIGTRKTMLMGLAIIVVSTLATARIQTPLELTLTWGVGVGLGVGLIGVVMGATIATTWFVKSRGLALGLLSSATAIGQLAFMPGLAVIAEHFGWRLVGPVIAAVAVVIAVPILIFMRDRPEAIGLKPYGATDEDAAIVVKVRQNPLKIAFAALGNASRKRDFWLLSGTFFVCGASANGFIGTHFIPACGDHGIPEVQAAGILSMMGAFNLIGAMSTGWLSDRMDCRILLCAVYGLRAISLVFVPYAFGMSGWIGLPLFAIFYGLDWIATLPPTLRLTIQTFGREEGPVVFGWVQTIHQVGAALIALSAGIIRTMTSSYTLAFDVSAVLCLCAAIAALGINRTWKSSGKPPQDARPSAGGPSLPLPMGV